MIRVQQYYFPNANDGNKNDIHLRLFFESLTLNMPYNILEISKDIYSNNETNETKNSKRFIGLSNNSYILIIITYIITYFIILEGLMRNLLYSIYVNIIQVNPNNNPYNNPDCVTKITKSSYVSYFTNYTGIIGMSLIFLLPISIPFLMKFLNFDDYNVKKNVWFSYVILFLIFSPLLITIINKSAFYKKLEIFSDLIPYLETSDAKIVDEIKQNFNFNLCIIYIFLFVVIFYCIYNFIHIETKANFKEKMMTLLVIFFIVYIFIPLFIICVSFIILYTNNYSENITNDNIIDNIREKGVSSLYELLVKYNYPCFLK